LIIHKNIISIKEIHFEDCVFKTKIPIIFEIKNSKDEYFYIESDFFGLFVYSQFYEDITLDFKDTFLFLWKEYVENTSEPLTSQGAIIIRHRLQKYFTKTFNEFCGD
jgi:hypothetical protein